MGRAFPIRSADGRVIGIACTRMRPKSKPCSVCKSTPGPLLCDGKATNGASRTCDAPLCAGCARNSDRTKDKDFCPKCAGVARVQ